jgi:hypothetical protein
VTRVACNGQSLDPGPVRMVLLEQRAIMPPVLAALSAHAARGAPGIPGPPGVRGAPARRD